MKKRKGLRVLIIIVAVIVILVAAGLIVYGQFEKNMAVLMDIQITDTDLSAVPDGSYKGSYKSLPVDIEVEVNVIDGRYDSIKILKNFGGVAESIVGKVVEAQSLEVDAVSGATCSSKAILLAIQDALKNAG